MRYGPVRALTLLGLSAALSALRAERLDRNDLLTFHDAAGAVQRVHTLADWQQRRAETVAGMQAVMGPLPGAEKRVPLDVQVVSETDCGTYVRREIFYTAEPDGRVPAFLLIPKTALEGKRPALAVLALMPTNGAEGHLPVVGLGKLGSKPGRNYGEELALRGFAVIAPPYPHLGDYKPDLKGLGYASGTMKAIWDNIRAVDVLDATPGIVHGHYGVIGHSLGGHNAIYTAVFDERLTVVISSCGFDSYLDYYKEKAGMWNKGAGWTQERYMPRMFDYAKRKEQIPFDFHELVGALAPRPFFVNSPLHDANYHADSVDRVLAAARPIYELYQAADRIAVEHPDCEHDFPADIREKSYVWLERFLK